MRILITVDPELPVPPLLYGGIERVVDLLARQLASMGHHVTLFANPASTCPVELRGWPGARSRSGIDTIRNAAMLTAAVARGRFDIIHSTSRLIYLLPLLPLPIPKIMNYHRRPSRRTTAMAHKLARGTLEFSAVGRWMTQQEGLVGAWHAIPNCIPLASYQPRLQVVSDAPLAFLGRIEEVKGPHLAIEIAKRTGRRLVMAGNVPREHEAWFKRHIAPHIDGERVAYIGPVDDTAKNEFLGRASALLMPIIWEEPFGLVMAEAMACGTPVLALRRGATDEVIAHGTTGFVGDTVDDLVEAVELLPTLSRAGCRERVERLYSEDAVATQYCALYEGLIERVRGARERKAQASPC